MRGIYRKMTDFDILSKKYSDLAAASDRKGIFTFTGFLGLSEKDILLKTIDEEKRSGVGISYTLYGGYVDAERVICRFGNPEELGYEQEFPIACIKVEPLNGKFADKLSHRDYLGSLMNLGITRAVIGDIIVEEKKAYIFCAENMAEMIEKELVRIKHTTVVAKKTNLSEEKIEKAEGDVKELKLTVSSLRADAMISGVYKKSRSQTAELFTRGLVYIEGRQTENPSQLLKEGQSVNVRGMGKFIFEKMENVNKKGKNVINVRVFA